MQRLLVLLLLPLFLPLYSTAQFRDPTVALKRIEALPEAQRTEVKRIFKLLGDGRERREAFAWFDKNWKKEHIPIFVEFASFLGVPEVTALLERKTGEKFGRDTNRWFQWLWSEERPAPAYQAELKGIMYSLMDPRFPEYFDDNPKTTIRLDEIRWGGVRRDGIPPLRSPKMTSVKKADWLGDDNVVFGVSINGDHRAYPKRILAWHEMFTDTVGGESVNGVYCTLCGSLIIYRTIFDGTHHELGTSGFLYRSNKLMYDQATKSMWNTLTGEPVVGPLVGKNIRLKPLHAVTTTWGVWRKQHPDTKVLSLDTGHRRDYGEGVAYKDYFGNDKLMFTVPKIDKRLKNKDEVLIPRFGRPDAKPLAISADYLRKNTVYKGQTGGQHFVVLTDEGGGNRIYERGAFGPDFKSFDGSVVTDDKGQTWAVSESELTPRSGGKSLSRLPAHRAFWFGWHATHPDTELVK